MLREPIARGPIFTIGHDSHERAAFLSLLACQGVNLLVDVRTNPYSRYMPQFSKEALSASLRSWGVGYLHLGRELGGRAMGRGIEEAVSFARSVDRIMDAWRQAYRLALLCAEEDPRRCHRAGRIAPALLARGAKVVHIRGDGRLEPHTPAWTDFAMACLTGDQEPR
ncbi:DUF488 domain-containing protein [Solidesulfovibrio sp.]|jgi:uncharacterized protein (DUF488 family)|uniref:DUF488 domain-containing protein n=1 Tax=Solidesulfovibrio sp. TaxID=2910990 RepID=UPI002B1FF745|nr:DUF488 domain-containing protein [Solidesulfovibrio sp.]MEA4857329.1 DUF488 domain-containing protein [Solidesulfovibrio sp.]